MHGDTEYDLIAWATIAAFLAFAAALVAVLLDRHDEPEAALVALAASTGLLIWSAYNAYQARRIGRSR